MPEVVALANLIKPGDDVELSPPCVRHRARLIKNVIWDRALNKHRRLGQRISSPFVLN